MNNDDYEHHSEWFDPDQMFFKTPKAIQLQYKGKMIVISGKKILECVVNYFKERFDKQPRPVLASSAFKPIVLGDSTSKWFECAISLEQANTNSMSIEIKDLLDDWLEKRGKEKRKGKSLEITKEEIYSLLKIGMEDVQICGKKIPRGILELAAIYDPSILQNYRNEISSNKHVFFSVNGQLLSINSPGDLYVGNHGRYINIFEDPETVEKITKGHKDFLDGVHACTSHKKLADIFVLYISTFFFIISNKTMENFDARRPSYPGIFKTLKELKKNNNLTDVDIVKKMRATIKGKGGAHQDKGINVLLSLLCSIWFLSEVNRNPACFLSNLILLDFIEAEIKFGLKTGGEKKFKWKNVLGNPDHIEEKDVKHLTDQELSGHFSMNHPGSCSVEFRCNSKASASISKAVAQISNGALRYEEISDKRDCFYHAVALCLKEDQGEKLREKVAEHIQNNLDSYRDFIVLSDLNGITTVKEYIDAIREGKEWTDRLEIIALMKILGRPIVIVGSDGRILNELDISKDSGRDPIFIYYRGHNCYDALLLNEKTPKKADERTPEEANERTPEEVLEILRSSKVGQPNRFPAFDDWGTARLKESALILRWLSYMLDSDLYKPELVWNVEDAQLKKEDEKLISDFLKDVFKSVINERFSCFDLAWQFMPKKPFKEFADSLNQAENLNSFYAKQSRVLGQLSAFKLYNKSDFDPGNLEIWDSLMAAIFCRIKPLLNSNLSSCEEFEKSVGQIDFTNESELRQLARVIEEYIFERARVRYVVAFDLFSSNSDGDLFRVNLQNVVSETVSENYLKIRLFVYSKNQFASLLISKEWSAEMEKFFIEDDDAAIDPPRMRGSR